MTETETRPALTIRHTHAEGTLIEGSQKGDGVYELIGPRTPHRFRFFWSIGRIGIRGSRDKLADRGRIEGAAEALRAAGWTVAVEIDDQWRPAAEREADRGARVNARVERLQDRAAAASARSAGHYDTARRTAARIPLGEPVKMGHHSASRHLRDLRRIEDNYRRSHEEANRAQDLESRAQGAASNEAHKHNPRAIIRRIERLEASAAQFQRSLDGHTRNFRNSQGEVYYTEKHDPATGEHAERLILLIEQAREEVKHLKERLAASEKSGEFVPWDRGHFRPGDLALVGGRWKLVRRVNQKTLSVAPNESVTWVDRVPYHEVWGRRRDGEQLNKANGEPWPVELADKVAAWKRLRQSGDRESAANVRRAVRIVLGLDADASAAEVEAFPPPEDIHSQRVLHAACLDVHERLQAGERPDQIRASLPDLPVPEPEWRLPSGEPVRVRSDRVVPGDVVRGVWVYPGLGFGPDRIDRSFCGLVEEVIPVPGYHELAPQTCVVLSTGDQRSFPTHVWLAVHRPDGNDPDDAGSDAEPDDVPAVEPEPEEVTADLEPAPESVIDWGPAQFGRDDWHRDARAYRDPTPEAPVAVAAEATDRRAPVLFQPTLF